MEANELRLGNYVLARCEDDKTYFEQTIVSGIFDDEIRHGAIGMTHPTWETDIENVKPIPLTEEWLLKLGFWTISAGVDDGMRYIKGFQLWKCNDLWLCNKNGVVIKSVHQLQNLYFALTGTELETKP